MVMKLSGTPSGMPAAQASRVAAYGSGARTATAVAQRPIRAQRAGSPAVRVVRP
jgi:hypothetical protein